MRINALLALTAAAFCICAPALAGPFPDLPGMHVAERATRGEVARVEAPGGTSSSGPGGTTTGGGGSTQGVAAADTSVAPSSAKTVADLPGGKSLPVISQIAFAAKRTTSEMPRGLTALAAIGTLLSVGGFVIFRRSLAD